MVGWELSGLLVRSAAASGVALPVSTMAVGTVAAVDSVT